LVLRHVHHSVICQLQSTHVSTLFPYTTLFRSNKHLFVFPFPDQSGHECVPYKSDSVDKAVFVSVKDKSDFDKVFLKPRPWPQQRSEEHTSELQSRENLVCRLLLEKKTGIQENI